MHQCPNFVSRAEAEKVQLTADCKLTQRAGPDIMAVWRDVCWTEIVLPEAGLRL